MVQTAYGTSNAGTSATGVGTTAPKIQPTGVTSMAPKPDATAGMGMDSVSAPAPAPAPISPPVTARVPLLLPQPASATAAPNSRMNEVVRIGWSSWWFEDQS